MKHIINYFCFRCNSKLHKEKELDYPFFCPNCEENMYQFESKKVSYKKKTKITKNK
jgi:transcription initiation factor IIE alpha subunit